MSEDKKDPFNQAREVSQDLNNLTRKWITERMNFEIALACLANHLGIATFVSTLSPNSTVTIDDVTKAVKDSYNHEKKTHHYEEES